MIDIRLSSRHATPRSPAHSVQDTQMEIINKQTLSGHRLPKTVVPKVYKVSLRPDLQNFLFDGSVEIAVQMVHPVTQISLNALALEILEALFITGNGKELQPTEISHASEILTLYLPEEVTGDGVLKIRFKGILDDDMKGLYRCKFDRPDGVTLFSAVTQFEPTFARKAFPCWDEPSFKAYFDIDVQAEQGKTVLSNMPEQERTSLENGSEVVHFKRTPLMSSYLIAIAVGDFEFIEDHVNDIQVRVYTSPGKKEQGRFGLEVAARVLPFYDKFFKIPYPLPKLDMIALTVISGAMENWGLITYQETMLLVDPENTSSIMKQTAAIVVAHEIAHMWFGNLVTMEWWTDLWLKEGFATFMEFLSIDRLYPEFHIWDQFVEDAFNPALEMDALENSHPVEVQVENPAQVHEIFDNISYSKGAAIIRMLHDFLSDEPFSNGLQSYLAKNKYGNTQTDNLWEALEGSSSVPVAAMMSTWTRQKGFPVISATLDGQEVQLQQACFTSLNTADATLLGLPVQSARTEKWMIPIKLIRGSTGEVVAHTVMKDEKLSLQVPPLQACEWIKLNPGTVAFYRVCYEKDLLMRFQPAIEGKTLPPLDRLGLLNDLYAMVISGKCSTNELLSFLRFYREEEEYPVWCSIANIIQKILALLEYSENFEKFRTFAVDLLTPIRQKVGWDPVPNEGHVKSLLRSVVLSTLVSLRDPEVLEECCRKFQVHISESQKLAPDLRASVYRGVAANGSSEVFDALLKIYRGTELSEEKRRVGRALGAFPDSTRLQKALRLSLTDEVRIPDTVSIVLSVAEHKEGRDLAWKFLQENWPELSRRYGAGFHMTRLLQGVTGHYCLESQAEEVKIYFQDLASRDENSPKRVFDQCIENIWIQARWCQRDLFNCLA